MKGSFFVFLIISCLFSCVTENKEIVRMSNLNYSVLTDSVYTRIPGRLLCVDKYVVWLDPLSVENYIHVLDAKSGKELKSFGRIGNGPEEFNVVSASLTFDSLLLLYDLNSNQQAFVDLNSVDVDSCKLYKKWNDERLGMLTRYLQMNEDLFLSFCPGASFPFVLKGQNRTDSIGKFPFSEKIENGYDIYQGEVLYNPDRKCLLYLTFLFPYAAMYELKSDKLSLVWEKSESINYELKERIMHLDTNIKKGISDATLAKDYIVTVGRDEEIEGSLPKQKTELDMAQLPRSIFLYDYDYGLQMIINFDFPILRVAANTDSNTLYAIIANPDFSIVKFDLP